MKHIFASLLLLAAVLLFPAASFAQVFEVDGINYDIINDNEAKVVDNNFQYTGDMTIPASVTNNGINYSVTAIGDNAFATCAGLTSINIPNSVTVIGYGAFAGCTGLTSINIPNSVTAIGYYAFSNCSSLTSIDIPNSITVIGDAAFSGCSSLTSIIIPNSVTSIGSTAFAECSSLISATIGDGVTSIEYGLFHKCSRLTSVTIGSSVEAIGEEAFYADSCLSNINIPNSVISIGDYALSYCRDLTSITIPNSVTSIGEGAFIGCSSLTSIDIPDSVTYIGNYTFLGCSSLINIDIPNSVTTICEMAFKDCSSLTSIDIPDSVTTICRSTFEGCSSLTSIDIPNYVTTIDFAAFYDCSSLFSIDIPNSVTTICESAFEGCSSLTDVTLPNSITTIGSTAFWGCSSLTSITIPNSVTTLCDGVFYGCSGLTTVTIPNTITIIDYAVFAGCSSLTSIDIPNSVTSIGNYAFLGCSNLTSIDIPNSVTSIGSDAFAGCSSLAFITVSTDNPIYDSRNNCEAIIETASNTLIIGCKNTAIPNSVTCIGTEAFSYCHGLTSIAIPNSVTTIGESAFSGCSNLTSITIPKSVNYIGGDAFSHCSRLKDVYSYIEDLSNITIGSDIFWLSTDYDDRTLYVPIGCVDAYQADTKWSLFFGSIVEMEPVSASSIELDKASLVMIEDDTLQLNATVLPDITTNKTVSWASSNPNVATVDENGLVTAVGLGSATITAMTTDGSNLSASCLVTVVSESVTNGLTISNAEALHGETITIPIAMVNEQAMMAFQTDIFLPEGFSLATNQAMEPVVTPSGRLSNDHVMMTQNVSNGAVRVMCYTPNALPIEGNEGDLFYITVQVPDDAAGDYTIYLRNTRLTTTDYTELRAPEAGAVLTVKTYIPGDVNDSRTVNVADIVATAMYIMEMEPSPFIFDAADMNGDGEVTVTDVMLIARMILYPETMNAPRHAPAIGANDDRMSGEVFTTSKTRTVSILLDNEMDYSAFQLDLSLPQGLTASNFQLTDRAGSHVLDVNTLASGKTRVLCYTPAIEAISGNEGAVLTFDVTANSPVDGDITVDGIELVTTACQMVRLDAFTIGMNGATAVNEVVAGKTIARVDYYNVAGQRLAQPESGVTLVVTTYTDGTCTTTKLIQ